MNFGMISLYFSNTYPKVYSTAVFVFEFKKRYKGYVASKNKRDLK